MSFVVPLDSPVITALRTVFEERKNRCGKFDSAQVGKKTHKIMYFFFLLNKLIF